MQSNRFHYIPNIFYRHVPLYFVDFFETRLNDLAQGILEHQDSPASVSQLSRFQSNPVEFILLVVGKKLDKNNSVLKNCHVK